MSLPRSCSRILNIDCNSYTHERACLTTTTIPSPLPPLDGSLNISEAFDFHLAHRNLTPIYSFAAGNEDDGTLTLTDVSHFEFARATHRVAHLLRPIRTGAEGEVVAILAFADTLLYLTLFAACSKAGLVPFPISPRNTPAALIHLLKTTNTRRVFTTHAALGPLVEALKAQPACSGVSIEEMPTLAQMYPLLGRETPDSPFTPYPPPETKASLDDVATYLHSSGSTGLPKAIPLTHRSIQLIASLDFFPDLVQLQPAPLPRLRIAAAGLPSFHATGVVMQFIGPLYHGITACIAAPVSLGTPTAYRMPAMPTPQNALRRCDFSIPAFIGEWVKHEEAVSYLKTLKATLYTGGPLSWDVGDALVEQGVKIVAMYGSTEIGFVNTLFPKDLLPSEWTWMQFSQRVNPRWVPVDDGTFELQCLTVPTHLPNVENLADMKGYSTEDLFERHPTKPHLYRIVGRLDDVLVMANGEKTVPGPMEDVITGSPYIASAIMFGRERNQIGVLVEPSSSLPVDSSAFLDLVWDKVQAANAIAPAFARVYREMIIVTTKDRPVVRTLKATVARKATIALYEADINSLYDAIETSEQYTASQIPPPASWTAKDLEPWLLSQACHVSSSLDPTSDLFEQGFDSLNATFLRHRIVSALCSNSNASTISHNFVYANPSIQKLARAIEALLSAEKSAVIDRQAAIEAMIAKYSQGLEESASALAAAPEPARTPRSCGGEIILLTGSTGGLGSHILDILLRHPSVERVYAFNRPGRTPVSQRQLAEFNNRALDTELLKSSKLVYLEGDSGRADLGISAELYSKLRETVTVIMHNAWTLDFNKSLSSFEPHVRGTRNLIDLARSCSSSGPARFLFSSSISSAQNWDKSRGAFPEEVQLDAGVALGSGYGESKYVSERILAASGLRATSFRIGQISGSRSNGSWATTDWFATIVKSSIALGSFPSDPQGVMVVSWISPEDAAQAIIDAAFLHDQAAASPSVFNLVHPRPVPWDMIVGAMAHAAHLPLVPTQDWVAALESRARTRDSTADREALEQFPALKLLEFIKGAMRGEGPFNIEFSTAQAPKVSTSVECMQPLTGEDALRWMRFWTAAGFI
ncbi:putative aminoadipate reductase [Mycena amicta]|nr:putative aminoadipate reductase [Mycena amicta]